MATTANSIIGRDAARAGWGAVLAALALVLAILALLFLDTARSMVLIWMRSDTYAHGFLILPISLWLVWERRGALVHAVPQPTLTPVWLMLPLGLLWLLGHLVDVLVVQQYAFVGLWILAIWAMLGTSLARFLAFPIGFLLFAVPVGEGLMYPMMNFTADFTVGMLRLTGIPVFRDGTFFSIPSGDWSVVEACSGIRYLLASVTLGVLYAYLTYTRLWKRLVFTGFAILVPVLANGLRAYMIVMIAHLSDMRLATGVDHLIYGWVFFGVVVTVMFAVGAFWRDPPTDALPRPSLPANGRGLPAVALSAVAALALWPGLAWVLDRPIESQDSAVDLQAPQPVGDWHAQEATLWDWRPRAVGADGEIYRFYRSPGGPVGLYLGVYRSQRQGSELVSSSNQMVVQKDPDWSDKEIVTRRILTAAGEMTVTQHRLASRTGRHLLVWEWYRVGALETSNPYLAKLAEVAYRLIGGRRDGALIAVAAPYSEDPERAVPILSDFVGALSPHIEAELDRSVAGKP